MIFTTGKKEHIPTIKNIAERTWPGTYGDILTREQIDYMINMMYSSDALSEQMDVLNHHFLLIEDNDTGNIQGFVSYEFDYKSYNKTKLHKLYVLPEYHSLGIGRILIDKVCEEACKHGNASVLLNMNRFNKSLGFYERVGFKIIGEEDIDIGNGFLMEDYIFERQV